MNNETIFIENEVLEQAKDICNDITNVEVRNIALANVFASNMAVKFFSDIDVDVESGIHNSYKLLEHWEVADIYINDSYIDVRCCFDTSDLCVPVSHFQNDLLPVAYLFVKLESDLSGAQPLGFVTPDRVDTSKDYNGYYKVLESDLISFYDVEYLLINEDFTLPDDFDLQLFDYLDGVHSNPLDFSRMLLSSKEARIKFLEASNTIRTLNYVSIEPALVSLINDEPKDSSDDMDLESIEELVLAESSDSDLELDDNSENEVWALEEGGSDLLEEQVVEENLISDEENDSLLDVEDSNDDIERLEVENVEVPLTEDFSDELLDDSGDNLSEDLIEENGYVDDFSKDEHLNQAAVQDDIAEEEIVEQLVFDEDSIEDSSVMVSEEEADYTTVVTPSIQDFEEDDLDEEVQNQDAQIDAEVLSEDDLEDNSIAEENNEIGETQNSSQQINSLFGDNTSQMVADDTIMPEKKKSPLTILLAFVLLGFVGYYGYSKLDLFKDTKSITKEQVAKPIEPVNIPKEVALPMPDETIENVESIKNDVEGNSLSIPVIEKNLDASILVSNLSVSWEVPSAYASNISAKRYFTKLGKILQLNLKTELMLLNKPPITDKITLELEFNKSTHRFGVKNITLSSGEETIDRLIEATVKNILSSTFGVNMNIFDGIQGNPVLVIRF